MGAFVEGELYLSWMHIFTSLFFPLFFYFLFLLLFLFTQELTRGHCLGMVAIADNVTNKYFHRDEKVGS
jgi:hypothetical protein